MIKRPLVKPFEKDKFELCEDYLVRLEKEKYKFAFEIKKGFVTNGASIPRVFWVLYPPFRSEYFSAALLHDFLCEKAASRDDYKIADLCLRLAMSELECGVFKTWLFYTACSLYHSFKCFFKKIK